MPRVLIAPTALANLQAEFVDVLKGAGFELVYHGRPAQLTEEQLLEALDGIDASLASAKTRAAPPNCSSRWRGPSTTPTSAASCTGT